jgi:hypothetical protein
MNAMYSAEFKRRYATPYAPRRIPHAEAWGYGRSPLTRRNPGDLVLDPTCGSGTTAYVAEQWGRRWISIDTSRVPLALARQRLLTATFPYYEIQRRSPLTPPLSPNGGEGWGEGENNNPAHGFVYRRRQNAKGEEVGGIVPHVTLKSIANNEPPEEEVLVDRPEVVKGVVRVTGPFVVEATIPTLMGVSSVEFPVSGEGAGTDQPETRNLKLETNIERMLDVLRRSPVLRLPGNQTVTFKNVRQPAKTLSLHAEAEQEFQVSGVEFQEPAGNLKPEAGNSRHGSQVSGPHRVAEGHGPGRCGVSADPEFSQGGSLRSDQPNATGGSVRAEQCGGGTRAAEPGGIPPIPRAGSGVAAGAGNAGGAGAASGLPIAGSGTGNPPAHAGSVTPAQRADLETGNLKLETRPVAFVFGPENGAVSEQLVFQAAKEAYAKSYRHLYVIGFAIQDAATKLIQNCEAVVGIPATYVAATMDLQMHDLLKTTRASQIFSVTGAPEIRLVKLPKKSKDGDELYQVELLGLDVFDPVTMETTHRKGDDVPAWFLDTDYNELAFCVAQAFFPRTAAWDNLKRALRGVYADSVWEHLAGTVSEPFAAGEHQQVAVKVIDDRGNDLLVVKKLEEAT